MQIRELNREEIGRIYDERLRKDFPRAERKSLKTILRCYDRGFYLPMALTDGDDIPGYAFFTHQGGDYLLDYLATDPKRRNCGLGSQLLGLLREALADAHSVILEVEDPAFAETDADRELQTRRIGFYARNGFVDTGVTAFTFGVRYRILAREQDTAIPADEIRAVYYGQFRAYLPESLCRRVIRFD